jgi:hypothetical protein
MHERVHSLSTYGKIVSVEPVQTKTGWYGRWNLPLCRAASAPIGGGFGIDPRPATIAN